MSEVNKYITSIPTLGLHSTFKHRRFPEYGVKLLTNIIFNGVKYENYADRR